MKFFGEKSSWIGIFLAAISFVTFMRVSPAQVERLRPGQSVNVSVNRAEDPVFADIDRQVLENNLTPAEVKSLISEKRSAGLFNDGNPVNITARQFVGYAADGSPLYQAYYSRTGYNLRTSAGANWQSGIMAGKSGAASCTYLALSNDSAAPSSTDTAVASEIATNGLSRHDGTFASTSGAASYTLAWTWTATTTAVSSQKAGLLTSSSSGTLCFENTYGQVTLNTNDTLTVTWTINF